MPAPSLTRLTSRLVASTAARFKAGHRPPADIGARHSEWSVISSADDMMPKPTDVLITIAVESAEAAMKSHLTAVMDRTTNDDDRRFVMTWPGEHYRLLAALGAVIGCEHAVEVGTYKGLGALSLAETCGRVVSYDVLDPLRIEGTALCGMDLEAAGIELRCGDLADPTVFDRERDILERADLIFCDGPKDGVFEQRLLAALTPLVARTGALLVVDDIRVMPMVRLWRDLDLPKLDVTSFGHWSGTGIASTRVSVRASR